MVCENKKCNKEFFDDWRKCKVGIPRFCCRKCSCSSSTIKRRDETNQKLSKTLKEKYASGEIRSWNKGIPYKETHKSRKVFKKNDLLKGANTRKLRNQNRVLELYENNWNQLVSEYDKRWWKKFILKEQNNKCSICGNLNEWNGKLLVLQVDHIDGNSKNDNRENLRMICPNCHSQTETFTSKNIGRYKN